MNINNKNSTSIGFIYSKQHRQTRRRSSSSSSGLYPKPGLSCSCECNASHLQEELECLRQSTKDALQQTWDEVETLNQKCVKQEEEIEHLKAELAKSLKREKRIKRKLDIADQELKSLKERENQDQFDGTSAVNIPRSTSTNMFSNLLSISNHSAPAITIPKWKINVRTIDPDTNQNTDWTISDSSRHSSNAFLEDDIDQLRVKLEQREQEIQSLEEVISKNTETFQKLHMEGEK